MGLAGGSARAATAAAVVATAFLLGAAAIGAVTATRAFDERADANSSLDWADREVAWGNGWTLTSDALYAARSIIPPGADYAVLVGPPDRFESPLTGPFVARYFHYFLMPRRQRSDARWVVCYRCGPLRGDVLWRDPKQGVAVVRRDRMRDVLGLAGFIVVFTAGGFGFLLSLLRLDRRDVLLLAPFAYVVGLAGVGTLATIGAVVGVPLSTATFVIGAAVPLLIGALVRRRREPRFALPRPRATTIELVVAVAFAAATIVLLEASFRAARLEGLFGWDAGAFWVPKAEALYYTGGFDEYHFSTLPGQGYPPLVPVLQAAAFFAIGAADPAVLHLVYWTVLAGTALAAAGLVSRVASPALAWASVVLVLIAGEVVTRSLVPQGDFLMDVFLAFALLLLLLFIRERTWEPAALALAFAAAAALTKREAIVPLAAMAVGVAVATAARRRQTWPWAGAVLGAAVLVLAPWLLWVSSHSLPGPGPEAGGLGLFDNLDRLPPSVALVLTTLGDPEHWSVILAIVVSAVAASLLARREEGIAVAVFLVLSTAGFVWIMWGLPSVPLTQNASLNPVVRLCGAALIPCALAVPILVQPLLEPIRARFTTPSARTRSRAIGVVAVVALAYPAAVLAVDGLPRFPDRDECSDRISRPEPPFEVIYARSQSYLEARATHERVVALGFVDAQLLADGCGRWKVANLDVDTAEQLRGHLADARRVGYDPWLERS